jgi:hypothetical protein
MKFGIEVFYQTFILSDNFINIGCDSRHFLNCIIEYMPGISNVSCQMQTKNGEDSYI